MPLPPPAKKSLKKVPALPAKGAVPAPVKAPALAKKVASKDTPPKPAAVAAPKADAKKAKAPKEPRAKLCEGPYNFLLARLRRKAAEFFSDGDKAKKTELTSGLRQQSTFLGARQHLISAGVTPDQFDKFLDEDLFIPNDSEEK